MRKKKVRIPHDADAHADPKLVRLVAERGAEAYGVYWYMVELLYASDGRLSVNALKEIAWRMRCPKVLVRRVAYDYGLFSTDGEYIWSERARRELAGMMHKSQMAKESVKVRWQSVRYTNVYTNVSPFETQNTDTQDFQFSKNAQKKEPETPSCENGGYGMEVFSESAPAGARKPLIRSYTLLRVKRHENEDFAFLKNGQKVYRKACLRILGTKTKESNTKKIEKREHLKLIYNTEMDSNSKFNIEIINNIAHARGNDRPEAGTDALAKSKESAQISDSGNKDGVIPGFESERPATASVSSSAAPLVFGLVVSKWNSLVKDNSLALPTVKMVTPERERAISLRWAEFSKLGDPMAVWDVILENVKNSSFLSGGTKADHKWMGFDWLFVNNRNWLKVYEGNYTDGSDKRDPKLYVNHYWD